ncbi:MAG: PilZ domain-containing protein [Rhodospirillaceae bacterium]|nr:PilZ domain-containing protein [Rhodospirillaceae bacterium]
MKTKSLENLLVGIQARLNRAMPHITDEGARAALTHALTDLAHALVLVVEPDNLGQRSGARFHEEAVLVARLPDNRKVECVVQDISVGGAMLEFDGWFEAATSFGLTVPGIDREIPATVLERLGESYRVKFVALSESEETALRKHLERHLIVS